MKNRLLFIPLHYNADIKPHKEWFDAMNHHFDTVYFNSCVSGNFDYVLLQSGAFTLSALNIIQSTLGNPKVIQWTGDCRPDVLPEVMAYKETADLTLLVAGIGQKEMYETALGSPVDYLQQGVFNSFFIAPIKIDSGKVVFIGNNYDQFPGAVERSLLCLDLAKFSEFETIGNGWDRCYNNTRSIPYDQSAKIYNESYISISHACFNDVEGYYSNRTLDIMAAGGCCLMRRTPNIEQFFTDGYDCVLYSTNEEAVEKIKYLQARTEIRNLIALNGHNTAKQKHTFGVRAKEIKQLIEKHL